MVSKFTLSIIHSPLVILHQYLSHQFYDLPILAAQDAGRIFVQ